MAVPIDPKLIVRDSPVRAAIPILPMPLAMLCFVFNLLVPGLGKQANPDYFFFLQKNKNKNNLNYRNNIQWPFCPFLLLWPN
jgi:hypothetical protein